VSRPLSILFFSNSFGRGGAEEHILTLLRGLDRSLFRPHLACTPEVAELLKADLPCDVDVTTLRLRSPRHLGEARRLAGLVRSGGVDILHSHLFYASVFASPIGRLCRVPAIIETPHVREHWRRGWLKGRFVVDRLVGRCVDRYIAVSEANARYLIETKRIPSRKVTVIRNGCDTHRFDPWREPPAALRPGLGFGALDPVLVVLGRLEPQKGHSVLLRALPAVVDRFPTVRVICLGEGSLRQELEAQTERLGLAGTVRFVGFQADVRGWLALADLTILPSLWEGLPLAAIESLAAGRPVVATAVDGTPEVVWDGYTGLTVPPGEAAPLASAICTLLAQPDERRRLGLAGHRLVTEHFHASRQIRQTEDLYLSLLGRRDPRPRPSGPAWTGPSPTARASTSR
jgi:glycosyltransferase involved in cell wall biosynthesis